MSCESYEQAYGRAAERKYAEMHQVSRQKCIKFAETHQVSARALAGALELEAARLGATLEELELEAGCSALPQGFLKITRKGDARP